MEPASPHLAHFKTQLVACPMIAILRGLRPVEAPSIGQALWHAGFRIIEVPLNSPQALQSIALLRQLLPNAIIGAGTVLTAKEVQAVHKAGGQIILAPICVPASSARHSILA